jgi:hypothetical protein
MRIRSFSTHLAWFVLTCCLPALPAPAAVSGNFQITEFMAANSVTLADEDGEFPDWIEIHNPGNVPASLDGWFLDKLFGRR